MLSMHRPTPIAVSVKKQRLFDPHDTPHLEALAGLPLASFGQRLGAFLIDLIVVLLIFIPVEVLRQYLELSAEGQPIHIAVSFHLHELRDLLYFIVYAGLCVWLTNGQTLGKRLFRIRIVSLTHARISLWQAIERALGYGASALEAGFGFMQFFIHHNRQCVHDRIAETIVVRDHLLPPS